MIHLVIYLSNRKLGTSASTFSKTPHHFTPLFFCCCWFFHFVFSLWPSSLTLLLCLSVRYNKGLWLVIFDALTACRTERELFFGAETPSQRREWCKRQVLTSEHKAPVSSMASKRPDFCSGSLHAGSLHISGRPRFCWIKKLILSHCTLFNAPFDA